MKRSLLPDEHKRADLPMMVSLTSVEEVVPQALTRGQTAGQLRAMARQLTEMAMVIERFGGARATRLPGEAASIEREAGALAAEARKLITDRRLRHKFFGPDLFGEPAWDILLDLYCQQAAGRRVAVKDSCIASAVPATTALRYIEILHDRGMIKRSRSSADRRRTWLDLDTSTSQDIGRYLRARRGS